MKIIATFTLIVGLAISGLSAIAQAKATAGSAHIISDITSLRQANNYEEFTALGDRTSITLRTIQDSFILLIELGALTAILGLVGLIEAIWKQPKECGQQAGAGYPPQGVGSPDPRRWD